MIHLTVEIIDGGPTLMAEVSGLPGRPPLWVVRGDDGRWRTLLPVRGCPVRLPERPGRTGELPALGAMRRALLGAGQSPADIVGWVNEALETGVRPR